MAPLLSSSDLSFQFTTPASLMYRRLEELKQDPSELRGSPPRRQEETCRPSCSPGNPSGFDSVSKKDCKRHQGKQGREAYYSPAERRLFLKHIYLWPRCKVLFIFDAATDAERCQLSTYNTIGAPGRSVVQAFAMFVLRKNRGSAKSGMAGRRSLQHYLALFLLIIPNVNARLLYFSAHRTTNGLRYGNFVAQTSDLLASHFALE